jgi:TolB-like protein
MAEGDGMEKSSEAESDLSGTSTPAAASRSVFLSYASHDADTAQAVCQFLESHGVSCWMAPRDVKPGTPYADAIVRAINEAKAVVLVLSGKAVASDHVAREVERAASKHKPIIAFRIDGAALNPGLEYFLSNSQWIDVPALGMPAALKKLAEAVGQGSAPTSPEVAPGIPAKSAGKTRRLAIAAVVVGVGVATALGVRFWSSGHRAQQPVVSAVSEKSIAVLPFTDMSEKHDQEYFGDGMAEEILDLLAKIPGLTVIGRTSSFAFKGKNEDLRAIGTKLNAAYVLEGSVRNSGDQVRITAQLINTRTGAHEWSETYDRKIGDVLKLQDAIAAAVARELQLTVASGYLNSGSTVKNAEAYNLVLRGRHAADRTDKDGLDEAVTLFKQALELDPTSADAEAELAITYVVQVLAGSLAPTAGFEQARRAATNALKLDPKNVPAHVAMAYIHIIFDWDWVGVERELQQAIAIAPGNVDVLYSEAVLAETLGRWDDALRQIKAALAQDPLDIANLNTLSDIQEARGHWPEAEAAARRVLDIHPTTAYGHYNLGYILLERDDRDGALHEMQQETMDDGRQQGLALVYFALGKKAEADAALASMLKDQADGNALSIAEVYAFRDQSDEAMHWLERAYAQKDPYLYKIKGDLLFKNLAGDPRYKAFLKKMNLPE